MNKHILHKEVQDHIDKNLNTDLAKFILKGSPFIDVTIQELAEQVEAKKKAQNKLPTWFQTPYIYYPHKLNIEQTSSEVTARYKSKLVSGKSLIDITGGFGVDSYFFSKQVSKVTHCEIDLNLSDIARYNFQILKTDNIVIINEDCISYLQTKEQNFDWIFIDPSRRSDVKGKVFLLEDCEPNIPETLELLLNYSNNILIKASPILDITSAINELNFVKEVHVVAVQNEVKELLFVLEKYYAGTIMIKTVNHKKDVEECFESEYKSLTTADYSLPQLYLYEPNAAILKAGLFNEVSHQLKLNKLHVNSHLYTLNNLIYFPGRRFKINSILPYSIKELKKQIPTLKANITIRNFPETVAKIRKKTKLKEGGDHYLFFTTDCNDKHVILICEKI